MNKQEVKTTLGNVRFSMEMEGFHIDNELESYGTEILLGLAHADDLVTEYIQMLVWQTGGD